MENFHLKLLMVYKNAYRLETASYQSQVTAVILQHLNALCPWQERIQIEVS